MNTSQKNSTNTVSRLSPIFRQNVFSRIDNNDDAAFYARERFVNHLDSLALDTTRQLIGSLIIEDHPVILDLMAGWDSHIPGELHPSRVVGLGLNEKELEANDRLDERIIHDLNEDPSLPFPSNTFDAVLNIVSVDYMTRPLEVFREAGRILKPGGLFLVVFSNRMFPQKAVKIWRDSDEGERVILVEEFFRQAGIFEKPLFFASRGKPRPKDDKYAHLEPTSDPVYAVYADKKGAVIPMRRPEVRTIYGPPMDKEVLEAKTRNVKNSLCCPHCDEALKKWAVPDNPFCQTWDNDFMYICFNDECPYFVRGWDKMYRDTSQGMSYRFMYNPDRDSCLPMPVPTARALREGIVEEDSPVKSGS